MLDEVSTQPELPRDSSSGEHRFRHCDLNRNSHRHEDVEKRRIDLNHAGAHFIDELKMDLVVCRDFATDPSETRD